MSNGYHNVVCIKVLVCTQQLTGIVQGAWITMLHKNMAILIASAVSGEWFYIAFALQHIDHPYLSALFLTWVFKTGAGLTV